MLDASDNGELHREIMADILAPLPIIRDASAVCMATARIRKRCK